MKEEHKEAPLEFKGAGAVHAHMVNVHALNYDAVKADFCLLYTSPSPRDLSTSRMPSSA